MTLVQQRIQAAFAAVLVLLAGLTLTLVSCERKLDLASESLGDRVNEAKKASVQDLNGSVLEAAE